MTGRSRGESGAGRQKWEGRSGEAGVGRQEWGGRSGEAGVGRQERRGRSGEAGAGSEWTVNKLRYGRHRAPKHDWAEGFGGVGEDPQPMHCPDDALLACPAVKPMRVLLRA